jgi:hypothetical protein
MWLHYSALHSFVFLPAANLDLDRWANFGDSPSGPDADPGLPAVGDTGMHEPIAPSTRQNLLRLLTCWL